MSEYGWLATFCSLIVLISLCGGFFPLLGRITHNRLQYYLSLSAGVMLGAAFFHVMPDAMEYSGSAFGWWMSLAVVGLFCIERFIAPHSHEVTGAKPHNHDAGDHYHDEHHHTHGDERLGADPGQSGLLPRKERAAAPAMAGWAAVLGLTIHTFMNGVGLAAIVQAATSSDAADAWPGFVMFLAIFLHKPADALAISTVLSRKGVSRQLLALVQLGFGLMVPVGVVFYLATRGAIQESLQSQFTGFALSFSAGTFLFIALSDLLPEVQFHKHDRIPLFLALCAGVVLMGGIAILEGHEHGGREHASEAGAVDHHGHAHDHPAQSSHDRDDEDDD
jgi:zinc and cadmium transporter